MQTEKWKNYRMWSYVKDELPGLLASDDAFSSLDTGNCSIFGHSMGGHGEAAGTGMARCLGRLSRLTGCKNLLQDTCTILTLLSSIDAVMQALSSWA